MFVLELLSVAALAGASPAPPQRMTEIIAKEGLVIEALPGDEELCAVAREIAGAGPCLDPESCRALELWQGVFGVPGFRPADPRFGGGRFAPQPRMVQRGKQSPRASLRGFDPGPLTVLCPADRSSVRGAERAGGQH